MLQLVLQALTIFRAWAQLGNICLCGHLSRNRLHRVSWLKATRFNFYIPCQFRTAFDVRSVPLSGADRARLTSKLADLVEET